MLTRQEREQLIIDLYNQGKTIQLITVPTDDVIDIVKTFSDRLNRVQSEFNIIVYSKLENDN